MFFGYIKWIEMDREIVFEAWKHCQNQTKKKECIYAQLKIREFYRLSYYSIIQWCRQCCVCVCVIENGV